MLELVFRLLMFMRERKSRTYDKQPLTAKKRRRQAIEK